MNKERESCRIMLDDTGMIANWVCNGIGADNTWLRDNITLGFFADNQLIGGLIYHDIRDKHDLWLTIYTIDKRWCSRLILKSIFDIVFNILKCNRINILIDTDNCGALRFATKLGFVKEGLLRKYRENGKDCCFLSMLKKECKWRRSDE